MEYVNIQVKWFYNLGFLLLLFIVLFVFYLIRPIWLPILSVLLTALSPFLVAGFFSYLLHPLVERIHKTGLQRGLTIAIIYIIFFGTIGFAVYKGLPVIVNQMIDIAEKAPEMAETYKSYMNHFHSQTAHWPFGLHEKIESFIDSLEGKLGTIVTGVIEALSGLSDVFIFILLIPFISFYLLKDANRIIHFGLKMIPAQKREETRKFLVDVDRSLGGYIRGQLLVCTIIALCSAIMFWFIKMKYPLLLSSIVGVTNVIPYFGPFIGAIPAVLVALTISTKMVIKVIIIIAILQFLEGNVISPIIMGKTLKLHPLIIIFALLAGGEIGGILGLILAVPLLALIKVAIIHGRSLKNRTKS